MTIVGTDGKPRYEIDVDNKITDMRTYCNCETHNPIQLDEEGKVCLTCNLPIRIDDGY